MSYQAVEWALYHAPMLRTEAGRPDCTARQVLVVLAEHADEHGGNARPSALRIQWATGYDERTIQRALLRLERGALIKRDGVTREGVTRWRLAMAATRSEDDWAQLEAEAERARRSESGRRADRRHRAVARALTHPAPEDVTDVGVSGTQNPGHAEDGSMCPGRRIPASGTESAGVRDAESRRPGRSAPRTTHEPPMNHPGTTLGGSTAPKPPRPHDPPSSGHGNEKHRSTYMESHPPGDQVGDHRPRANTPPDGERATPDQTQSRLPAAAAPQATPDGPTGPITTAAAAELKTRGEPIPRCAHGMHDVVRTDGRHCCPVCRRNLPAEPPSTPAQPLPRPSGSQTLHPSPVVAQAATQAAQSPPERSAMVLPFRRPQPRPRKEPA